MVIGIVMWSRPINIKTGFLNLQRPFLKYLSSISLTDLSLGCSLKPADKPLCIVFISLPRFLLFTCPHCTASQRPPYHSILTGPSNPCSLSTLTFFSQYIVSVSLLDASVSCLNALVNHLLISVVKAFYFPQNYFSKVYV